MLSNYWSVALLCLTLATELMAKPTPPERRSPRIQERDSTSSGSDVLETICGDIMDFANDYVGTTVFYASDVDACLGSVPFNQAPALRFLDYYNTTLQFQSTLAFLKDPPAGYQQPAIDVEGVLNRIKANVTAGYYKTQYQFEQDVQNLVFAIHDGHVELRAGILSPWWFGSPISISSASLDGIEPPKVYFTQDIIAAQQASWTTLPSAITAINGQDAVTYLTQFAARNSMGRLEANAEWNDLMGHPTADLLDFGTVFTDDGILYPGDELNFTLQNATTVETFWQAYYNYPYLTGAITTGGDIYNAFVLGLFPAEGNETAMPEDDSVTVARRQDDTGDESTSWYNVTSGAYPANPDVYDTNGIVAGYFLNDISTGVLSIPTFDISSDSLDDFTDTVQGFINSAAENSLDRIVVDLQRNSGGLTLLALDTFFRFFPHLQTFAGSRSRSHELGNIIGNVTTNWFGSLDPYNDTQYDDWIENISNDWVITPRLNAETGKNFQNWQEYAGNRSAFGDHFTVVERYNLSNVYYDDETLGAAPYGYAYNPANTTAQWDPKDIVLLTDGLCSSTCALYVEFMTRVGVRTVAMGGTPTTGPMQAVGGTRGAREYWGDYLDDDMAWAGDIDENANKTLPNIPINAEVRNSGIWTTYSGFNLRDSIREEEMNSSEAIPLQFRYEAADCRLYYTLRNLYNMTQQWRDAATATWFNSSLCVQNSTGYSNTGNSTAINQPPTADATSQFTPFHNMTASTTSTSTTSDTTGGDVDPSDNQFDAARPNQGGLKACSSDKPCSGKFKCLPASISCTSPAKKTVTTPLNACLPPCADDQSCKIFDTRGTDSLTCWTSSETVSTKGISYSKLTGADAGNATIPKADTVGGKIKRCMPKSGKFKQGKTPTTGTCVL